MGCVSVDELTDQEDVPANERWEPTVQHPPGISTVSLFSGGQDALVTKYIWPQNLQWVGAPVFLHKEKSLCGCCSLQTRKEKPRQGQS